MKAVILLNGDPPSPELLKRECQSADCVICADGALAYAKDVNIDVTVGDFDSANRCDVPLGCEVLELPTHKEKTDGEVACELALDRGCLEIVLLGGLGGRLDHALGNVQTLVKCFMRGADAVLLTDEAEVRVTCKTLIVFGKKGDLFSLVPLGVNVVIRELYGLEYPLHGEPLRLGEPRGISNVFTGDTAAVEVENGWVMVIINRV